MPSDHDIAIRDLRRPVWEWGPELSSAERDELDRLRAEHHDLLARVQELHVAAQESHEREEALRELVRRLATGPVWARLRAARRLRRRRPASVPGS